MLLSASWCEMMVVFNKDIRWIDGVIIQGMWIIVTNNSSMREWQNVFFSFHSNYNKVNCLSQRNIWYYRINYYVKWISMLSCPAWNKGENIIIESFPLCVGSKLVIVCLNLLVIHSKLFSGTLYRTCRHCERSVGNTVLIEYVYYNLSFPLRLPPNTLSVKPSIFARNCLHFWEAKSFSIQFARTILSDHTLYEAVTPWHKPVKGFQCQYHCLSPAAQFPIQRCASWHTILIK